MLPRLPLPFNERSPIHGNGSFRFWWRSPPSEMNNLFISHAYYSFYNKKTGSSLDQWVPCSLNTCHRLIYDALSSDAIEEVEFEDGEVVDRRWILHHFDFSSFRIFGFLDDFAMPTARPGSSATRRHDYESDIQRAF